jgi:hypothetical protein
MEPRARSHGLIVETLDDEVLVFDQETQQCHVLNRTAAAVWRRCDGRSGVTALAVAAADGSGLPARPEIAALALDQLGQARLLESSQDVKPGARVSRRAVIQRLGLAAGLAALLPAVESIVAPRAAEAQSGPPTTSTTPLSDARLKQDLERVGELANGISLYRFRYRFGSDVFVGVLAQEVRGVVPEAVHVGPAGLMRVDYERLGTRLMSWSAWERTCQTDVPARRAARGTRAEEIVSAR